MGMAVFSGMLVATILGVLSIPALFVMIEGFGKKKKAAVPAETKKEEDK
jgi:HAE1 family hydrophobic/amphiphilic exporter-1